MTDTHSARQLSLWPGLSKVSPWPLLALCCCFTLTLACQRTITKRIAVIPRTTGVTLWEAEHSGASAAAAARHCDIYWNAPTHEDDVEDQILLLERVRKGGFDGIVLAPDHPLALLTSVQRVLSAGIPVVIVSSPLALPPIKNLTYVVNDDEEAGEIAARRIAAILHGKGSIAIIGVDPNVTGILVRMRSLEGYLSTHFPAISVIARAPGAFNAAEAQQATLATLSSAPQVNALVTLTAVSTRAAYFTLRGTNQLSTVKLVGFEQDTDMTERLKRGEVDSIIAEDTFNMGYRAVEEIAAERSGQGVPERTVLHPRLITRENAGSQEVKQLITMNWFREQ